MKHKLSQYFVKTTEGFIKTVRLLSGIGSPFLHNWGKGEQSPVDFHKSDTLLSDKGSRHQIPRGKNDGKLSVPAMQVKTTSVRQQEIRLQRILVVF
ncbi:hypothetical protein [Sediminibacillus massiliensis]|uniref:hypothetical protein n=1 Tax=Sediminibacillus massiliensis TaxID=1926277 RepID=UPI0011788FC5|nr:hypothetical protein [Sediminibacillus massiliensis]